MMRKATDVMDALNQVRDTICDTVMLKDGLDFSEKLIGLLVVMSVIGIVFSTIALLQKKLDGVKEYILTILAIAVTGLSLTLSIFAWVTEGFLIGLLVFGVSSCISYGMSKLLIKEADKKERYVVIRTFEEKTDYWKIDDKITATKIGEDTDKVAEKCVWKDSKLAAAAATSAVRLGALAWVYFTLNPIFLSLTDKVNHVRK